MRTHHHPPHLPPPDGDRAFASQASDPALRMMRYDAAKRSVGVAYLLWFCVGTLGAHRFYLGRPISGIFLLLITVTSIATFGFSLIVTGLWLLLDLLLIPGMARSHNEALIRRLH